MNWHKTETGEFVNGSTRLRFDGAKWLLKCDEIYQDGCERILAATSLEEAQREGLERIRDYYQCRVNDHGGCPRCAELLASLDKLRRVDDPEAELAALRAKLTRRGTGAGRKLTGEPKPSTLSSRASRAREAAGLPRLRAKKKGPR